MMLDGWRDRRNQLLNSRVRLDLELGPYKILISASVLNCARRVTRFYELLYKSQRKTG
jgi:hypothetical protein